MNYINPESTEIGMGERVLYQALEHNTRHGFSLALTQTLEMLLGALSILRGQTRRQLADDLRRAGSQLADELERIARCGPWIDGYRWRAVKGAVYRADVDPTPEERSEWNVGADDVLPLLRMVYTRPVIRRIPAEIQAYLESEGLTANQATDAPWIGWFNSAGEIVAVVAPIEEDGE